MRLDSARELKTELIERIFLNMARSLHTRPVLAVPQFLCETDLRLDGGLVLGVAMRAKRDFALAVRVQRHALKDGRALEYIRRTARGEVDVRYVGTVRKSSVPWHRRRQRPLLMGCSVGHYRVTAGTIGAFVRLRGKKTLGILSNNHVLANENHAQPGDPILQQSRDDGGVRSKNTIAVLERFVRLKRSRPNYVDCAVASLLEDVDVDLSTIRGLGKLKGVSEDFLDEGLRVAKVGRTTGLTRGRVTAFELDNVVVEFDSGTCRFDNQIEIEGDGNRPFCDGGDSGALVVGRDLRAVGLLCAASDQGGKNGKGLTYANPIHGVLRALRVRLAL